MQGNAKKSGKVCGRGRIYLCNNLETLEDVMLKLISIVPKRQMPLKKVPDNPVRSVPA